MNITVITAPPFEPVTLLEVYAHLRLTPDHSGSPGEESHPDDAMLSRHIASARTFVEQATRRCLVQQTLRLSMPSFPVPYCWSYSRRGSSADNVIRLYRPPIIAVEAVSYYDADNVLQLVDPLSYYTTDEQVPELRFASTFSWPTVHIRPDALRIEYRAGYTPEGSPPTTQAEYAASVPAALKDAILLGVQLLYDNLETKDREHMERAREAIMQPFRIQLAL
jgi:uncharacterized phiE125 gp8 family phage protein